MHPASTIACYRYDHSYSTDFRSVYSTVLGNWLEADAPAILGETFDPVPFV